MRSVFNVANPEVNAYRLLTALVVPRPIAWVSTVSADGVGNLAPHSFFTVASAQPPIVCFTSVGRKDTLRNVLATEEFVVNLATRSQLDNVNGSSAKLGPDVDEAEVLQVGMEPSEVVRPRRVVASPASLECVLHSTYDVGDSVMIFGRVVAITVVESALVDGHPDYALLEPIARLGRDEWAVDAAVISTPRPN